MHTRLRIRILATILTVALMGTIVAPQQAVALAPTTSPMWCSRGLAVKLCYQINGDLQWVSNFSLATIGNYTGVSPATLSYEVTGPNGQVFPSGGPGTVVLNNGSVTSRTINVNNNLVPGEYCAIVWADWGPYAGKCWAVEAN